ncbi:MAG: hypothetical protein ABJH05_18850 [Fulvivirga sp.]
MTFKGLLNGIIYSGTNDQHNPHLARRILFTNVIFTALPAVYIVFIALDYESYTMPISQWNFDVITVPVMIIYCALGIYLNRQGYSYLGRLGFLIIWPLLMHILPVILLNTPSDYYLAFPLGMIFHSILIQLFISFKREQFTFYLMMSLSLIVIVSFRDFLIYFDSNPSRINNEVVGSIYYSLVAILYWLLFNTITFYVIKVIDELIDKNEAQQLQLIDQNTELEQMNTVVDNTNKQLEKQVQIRTKDLAEANKTLTEYSFYNAHLIKGPFCRIKGLMMLKSLNAVDDAEFNERLNISLDELSEAIVSMQEQLNEVDKRPEMKRG